MVELSDESGSEDEEEKKRLKMAKGPFTRAFLTVGFVALCDFTVGVPCRKRGHNTTVYSLLLFKVPP